VEVGAKPLWDGQHPLPHGQVGQDVIGQVGGELRHAAGVARGADPAALAGERDQALVAAGVTARAGEAVGEDAAAEVGAEVLLHPVRHGVAHGVGFGRMGEEGLDVVLDDGVQGARRRMPRPVDGLCTDSARMPSRGRAPREALDGDRHGVPCRSPQGATMGD